VFDVLSNPRGQIDGMIRRCAPFVLLAALGGSVTGTALARDAVQSAAPAAVAKRPAPRDLAADERAGGHTLARHVGKSDAQLAERLSREREIAVASTYVDAVTAANVVGAALAQSNTKLDAWLARRGVRPNLVLNYTQTTGPPLGRLLRRGQQTSVPSRRALVVLRWDDRRGRWYVLTSYPEA
jgi:hypothetical protein